MIKILVQIKDNTINFRIRKKLTEDYKNMLNTNIISDNELLFSDTYINENKKIVISFIKELIKQYNVNTIIIDNSEITLQILDLIKTLTQIKYLFLNTNSPLSYKLCYAITNNDNIKYFKCYSMPDYMIEI